jgi:hypothetical protein
LDPRILPILSSIITDEEFEMVKIDFFNLMLAKTKEMNGPTNTEASASEFPVATPITQTNSKHRKLKQMFRGLNTKPQTNKIQMRQRKMMTKSYVTIARQS